MRQDDSEEGDGRRGRMASGASPAPTFGERGAEKPHAQRRRMGHPAEATAGRRWRAKPALPYSGNGDGGRQFEISDLRDGNGIEAGPGGWDEMQILPSSG